MPEDTDAALEWADFQATLCKGCGQPLVECLDSANDGAYEAEPIQCFACAARDALNRQVSADRSSERFGDGSFDGLFIGVHPKGVT